MKITLKKSLIGSRERSDCNRPVPGPQKVGDTTEQPDNAQTQGKVKKIGHLIEVSK